MAEEFEHIPVLAGEVLEHLVFPERSSLRLIDGTVGGGGHSTIAGAQLTDMTEYEALTYVKSTVRSMKKEGAI